MRDWTGHCQRCGVRAQVSTMSRFNQNQICMVCDDKERAHPSYAEAAAVELAAVQRGDYNFPGVGLPAELHPSYKPEEKPDEPFRF